LVFFGTIMSVGRVCFLKAITSIWTLFTMSS
jgi:hypothetical protein